MHTPTGNGRARAAPDFIGARDSSTVLMTAAGNAVSEKRNKTIMHCLRDRTPSYSRLNSSNYLQAGVTSNVSHHRPEAAAQSRRQQCNGKILYKSVSTQDLTTYMEMSTSNTTSSSASSSSQSTGRGGRLARCDDRRRADIKALENRLNQLEEDLDIQRQNNKTLESRLNDLSERFEELQMQQRSGEREKLKKSQSTRKKQPSSFATSASSVQSSKFVTWMKLSNWWKQRPTIQLLKEQNIYNDEPCFDTEIEMVLKHEVHKTVPKIIVDCCELIEEKHRKSTEPIEGLYRQCGDYNKIQSLRFSIDSNDYESLRQPNIDVHTLAGVLKLFLREIKSPVVSINEAKTFIGRLDQWLLRDLSEKIEILKRLIRSLPEINRDTMAHLFQHFNRLTKVPLQHVSPEILSLSVTPPIFQTVQHVSPNQMLNIDQLLKESEILSDCVQIMIEYHRRIFECHAVERRSRCLSARNIRKTISHPNLFFNNIFNN